VASRELLRSRLESLAFISKLPKLPTHDMIALSTQYPPRAYLARIALEAFNGSQSSAARKALSTCAS